MDLPFFRIHNNTIDSNDTFPIVVTNCRIRKDLQISQSNFSSPLYVEFCEIGSIEATSSKFERYTTFKNLLVDGDTNFNRSTFQDRIMFDSSRFKGDFTFSNVRANTISFKPMEVDGDVFYPDNYNPQSCVSPYNRFLGNVKFTNSEISSVRFIFSYFHSEADLGMTTYSNCYVIQCKFRNGLEMKSAIVDKGSFYTFAENLSFSHTKFNTIGFVGSSIDEELVVDFSECNIRQGTISSNDNSAIFCYPGATIGKVELDLRDSVIYETKFDGFDFSQYRDTLDSLKWNLSNISENVSASLNEVGYTESTTNSGWITTYIRAKDGARSIGNDVAGSKFFIKEMIYRRKRHADVYANEKNRWRRRTSSFITYINNWIYNISSRYGEGLGLTLVWTLAIIMSSTLIYPAVGGVNIPQSDTSLTYASILGGSPENTLSEVLMHSFYVSVVSFTSLGAGSYNLTSLCGRLIAGFESIMGALLVALIIFALGRRITR